MASTASPSPPRPIVGTSAVVASNLCTRWESPSVGPASAERVAVAGLPTEGSAAQPWAACNVDTSLRMPTDVPRETSAVRYRAGPLTTTDVWQGGQYAGGIGQGT